MEVSTCIACQFGAHDSCMGTRNPPEGMMGGHSCPCEGECVQQNKPQDFHAGLEELSRAGGKLAGLEQGENKLDPREK